MSNDDPFRFIRGKTSLGRIIEPAKPGRPPRSDVDEVQTRLWFLAVRHISGLASAYAIEMTLDGDRIRKRDTDIMRPRKWDQYANGKISPRDKKDSSSAVAQAESHFPGTAIYYQSAIWQVFRNQPLQQDEINNGLYALGPGISSLFFPPEDSRNTQARHQQAVNHETIMRIVGHGGFPALSALMLLINQSELISSAQLRNMTQSGYEFLLPKLRDDPIVGPVLQELMPLIDRRCKAWAFLSANQRVEIYLPSQAILDRYDQALKVAKSFEDA